MLEETSTVSTPTSEPITQAEQNEPDEPRHDEQVADTPFVETDYVSVKQAHLLYAAANVSRSERAITRYCGNGTLECQHTFSQYGRDKLLITLRSVKAHIQELTHLKAIDPDQSRLVETVLEQSRPFENGLERSGTVPTVLDASQQDALSEAERQEYETRIDKLKKENEDLVYKNRDLEITNRVKDNVLKKAEGQLTTMNTRLMRFNRAVGELATILRLKAPEHDTSQVIAYLDAPDDKDANLVDDVHQNPTM